ncbi:MAG: hypothetical protein PHU85_13285 [Phycisphaerae bacterium]|nr:hypothetical protein [Phycisphaerae bacterium]
MRLFNLYLPELDVTTIRGWMEAADRVARRLTPADSYVGRSEMCCPICGTKLRVPAGAAGRTGRCRGCLSLFPIPTEPASALAL